MPEAAIVRIDDTSFLAVARASVARREGAAAAGFDIVAPPGVFEVRVEIVAETLTSHREGGVFEIRQALVSVNGRAIDSTTVVARGDVGEDLLIDVLSVPTTTVVLGTAMRTPEGVELISIRADALPMAA